MLNVKEAAKIANAKILNPNLGINKNLGVLDYDSRLLCAGHAFVAVPGEARDGHEFLLDALNKGAAAALITKAGLGKISATEKKNLLEKMWLLECEDTVVSMGLMAHAWRKMFSIPIIGITGSNGKTTTKDILGSILQEALGVEAVLVSQSSLNNHLGVPHTLSKLNEKHKAAVLEMGINHFGEMSYLTKIAEQNAGLITNIGDSHLEYMVDRAGVFKEKCVLLDTVQGAESAWIINDDDPYLTKLREEKTFGIKKITYSLKNVTADFFVKNIRQLGVEDNFGFEIEFSQTKTKGKLLIPGEHNVQNALAAVAAAVAFFGQDLEQMIEALAKVKISGKRSEILKLKNGAYIFNDCYNANPSSMRHALAMIAQAAQKNPFFVALGEMKEMGKRSETAHFEIGEEVAKTGAVALAVCGEHAKDVLRGALAAGLTNTNAADSPEDLVPFLKKYLRAGSFLLVKGSRGAKMEKLIEKLKAEI